MPGRGRSSFTKRQKEHTRQQKQRDKAERRIQRKTDEPLGTSGDSSDMDLSELQKHAAEQAALFQMGADDSNISSLPARTQSGKNRTITPFLGILIKKGRVLKTRPFSLLAECATLLRQTPRQATWSKSGWPACFGRHAASALHWPNPPACVRCAV